MIMYLFTTSRYSPVTEHAAHNWESWSASLATAWGSDMTDGGTLPAWINGADTGICCHTCELVVIDRADDEGAYVVTPGADVLVPRTLIAAAIDAIGYADNEDAWRVADELWTLVAPADEAPADEAPADEAPADETPADEAPTCFYFPRVGDARMWATMCDRYAVTLVAHPKLGNVPACARCADRARA